MDRVHGIGLSLAKQRILRKLLSHETIAEAIARGVKRRPRDMPADTSLVATGVVEAVQQACSKKKKNAPETEEAVHALDNSGVWKEATVSLQSANPNMTNVLKLKPQHIKRMYMDQTRIPPADPVARPVTEHLNISVSHAHDSEELSFSGKFSCPCLPSFDSDQEHANSKLLGEKGPTPLSFKAISVGYLQQMQQVPTIIRNDSRQLQTALWTWKNQNQGIEVTSPSW